MLLLLWKAVPMKLSIGGQSKFFSLDLWWPEELIAYFLKSGSSLLVTSLRQSTLLQTTHQPIPPIPSSVEEFISTGVNSRPTFFGCDPPTPNAYPLIVYLPNSPPITGDPPATK